jgi:hypothetical protein
MASEFLYKGSVVIPNLERSHQTDTRADEPGEALAGPVLAAAAILDWVGVARLAVDS